MSFGCLRAHISHLLLLGDISWLFWPFLLCSFRFFGLLCPFVNCGHPRAHLNVLAFFNVFFGIFNVFSSLFLAFFNVFILLFWPFFCMSLCELWSSQSSPKCFLTFLLCFFGLFIVFFFKCPYMNLGYLFFHWEISCAFFSGLWTKLSLWSVSRKHCYIKSSIYIFLFSQCK